MTYEAYDQSVQNGDPQLLFLFQRGSTSYRFTSSQLDITAMSEAWSSESIDAGDINQSEDMTRDTLQLKFPRSNEFALSLESDLFEIITTVTLFRGYSSDPDNEFIAYWKGRVAGTSSDKNQISLSCEPVFTSLRRPGLRARYQRSCRHALYGGGCGVDKEDFRVDGTCTSAIGTTIVVAEAGGYADGYFNGGMVKTDGDVYRFITKHVGTSITLIRPVQELIEAVASSTGSAPVSLYPGCDHTRSVCASKFSNQLNYGGFPWIPTKNPFGGSSIV